MISLAQVQNDVSACVVLALRYLLVAYPSFTILKLGGSVRFPDLITSGVDCSSINFRASYLVLNLGSCLVILTSGDLPLRYVSLKE